MYCITTRLSGAKMPEDFESLSRSSTAVGLDVEVVTGVADAPSRASVILRQLELCPVKHVLYLEPGAVLRRRPKIFDGTDFDMAAYVHRMDLWTDSHEEKKRFDGIGWIFPYTLFFRNTDASRRVLRRWIVANEEHPGRRERDNLLYFLATQEISFRYLPPEYCWVERTMRATRPRATPVIEQLARDIPQAPASLGGEASPTPILAQTLIGLGDCFYTRPVVRKLVKKYGEVFVENCWPQLWHDIPGVKVVRPEEVKFHTHRINRDEQSVDAWTPRPEKHMTLRLGYNASQMQSGHSIMDALMMGAGVEGPVTAEEFKFNVPEQWVAPWMKELPRPLGIVHAPTLRKEWPCPSRNPAVGVIQKLISRMPRVHWVSVGRLEEGKEWLDGPPLSGIRTHLDTAPTIKTEGLVGLTSIADIALTGSGFLTALGSAVATPVFTVFGGFFPPERVIESSMPMAGFVAPQPFCACYICDHECDKTISDDRLYSTFDEFLAARDFLDKGKPERG